MRVAHLLLAVFVAAILFTVSRDEAGRVGIIVFFVGLGEIVLGLTAIMWLFKTLGSLGAARDLMAHLEALVATALVLVVATASMNAVLWVGLAMLKVVVDW